MKMNCCTCGCVDGKGGDNIVREDNPSPNLRLQFVQAGKSIQHPLKAALRSTNADAFAADLHFIGIADGVSTVEDEGLDPSELPVELLAKCLEECRARMKNSVLFDAEAEDLLSGCDVELDSFDFPLYVLTKASAQCTAYGSTTCVLAILENNRLWSANIGDSQLMVVRRTDTPPKAYPGPQEFSYSTCHDSRVRVSNPKDYGGYQIVYRTVPQQHFFNCPYQISRMPDNDCSGEAILRRTVQTADVGSAEVQPGDVVILGTDGLFDNVFDDDVLDLLNRMCWPSSEPYKHPSTDPLVIVNALLDLAVKAGQPPPGVCNPIITPFSKAAFDEVGQRLVGGKPDDITAVVAYIVPKSASEKSETASPVRNSQAAPASQEGDGKQDGQSDGPGKTSAQECIGGTSKDTSVGGTQLCLLDEVGMKQLPRTMVSVTRSSFPPRLHGVTTPAIKASIHSVPKALKAAEYMAFEYLRERAHQRVQRVVAFGPSQRNKSGDDWITDKTTMLFTTLRDLFS